LARELGLRIVALRLQRGLTQEKLAWEADLASKGYLSRIEAGKRLPSVEMLGRLADRLGVEIRDLFVFPERGEVEAAMERLRCDGPGLASVILKLAPTVSTKAKRPPRPPKRH
jgi:transcriptional regulator with XRE-family HTH domain